MPTSVTVDGFYDGGGVYRVRFAPPYLGHWSYATTSSSASLDGHTGSVTAVAPSAHNHGPVRSRGFRLVHEDGSPHFSVGSTSYQWASKGFDMQEQTLQTLEHGQAWRSIA
jgi:hypothetical protein